MYHQYNKESISSMHNLQKKHCVILRCTEHSLHIPLSLVKLVVLTDNCCYQVHM